MYKDKNKYLNTAITVLLAIIAILLTSCDYENKTLPVDNKTNQEDEYKSENSLNQSPLLPINEMKYSLENKVYPPKFSIYKFKVSYIKKNQTFQYYMEYLMDDEIYKSLTIGKQKMFLSLKFPHTSQSYFKTDHSELVEAPTPSDNKLNYSVTFNQPVKQALNDIDIKKLQNLNGYNLLVIDKDKDVIAEINDVVLFNDYIPGKSQSELITK